ncbi:ABC transporter ATP-binding protein [Chelativorans salis]|uniref:Spermidine/putrescine import ATP-binding protein PotA n=1 Tax=Chelativorans salis TaxID=2978478 RepID=A0ABT2LUQ7_9HYPH|nr:ABC transporter ATP-binding protein [Chelativorans sp. EGI FJ00035]MCT7378261.1 ABC transporter ATP-binding protein [Chelativorans sp. EGI FJ00035]
MHGASVSLRELGKSYGPVPAVERLAIDIRPGEFLSLLGPSGSGKTTLLMMVAGFERPDTGAIWIGDRNITQVAPNRRDIGMVFQRYALFPHMTVAENVAFPLRMRGFPKTRISQSVAEALSLVQLEGLEKRLPAQLSGGQQQRVAVARALVFEPAVLLMDEPLGALDKKLREQMQIEIKRLQQSLGITVIYVTHDQEEALTMSDRIAVLRDGYLEQVGSPADLYDAPATAFVADFIGKMNFLDGICRKLGADCLEVDLGRSGTIILPQQPVASAPPLQQGQRVRLAVRPERMKLDRHDDRKISGVIEAVIFAGASHTFLIRLAGGEIIHVQTQATHGGSLPQEGDRIGFVIPDDAVHVFPQAEC